MILSDGDIKQRILEGSIGVDPTPDLETQLGPCSLDLRLGADFNVFDYSKSGYIDTRSPIPPELVRTVLLKGDEPFVVQPGELVLAATLERLQIPDDLMARLDGRS